MVGFQTCCGEHRRPSYPTTVIYPFHPRPHGPSYWLPIQARINFKIATLTYKALSSGQPAYLRELISPYKPSRQLRSSDQSLLTIPRTNLTIGQHAFSWSSVFIWNSIPLSVRNAPTISTFKRRLKTFYFSSISS